jgi:NADH-quinone oxidoreductase subunit G
VTTARGSVDVPVHVADLPDGVVWLPTNSPGSALRATLGAGHGDVVSVTGVTGGTS